MSKENSEKINYDFSFDNWSPNFRILDDLVLRFLRTGDEFDVINMVENHVSSKGIYTPMNFQFVDSFDKTLQISGVVNLMHDDCVFDEDLGVFDLKFIPDNNSVFELMKGLKLRALDWSITEFKQVFNIRNDVPDLYAFAILSMLIFQIQLFVKQAIADFGKAIADSVGGITGPASTALKLVILTVYYGFLAVQFYKLLQDIADSLFQKKRRYYCINVKNTFEKACEAIGYTFVSTLFDGEMSRQTQLTETSEKPVMKGSPTNNPVPNVSLLQFFEHWGRYFNAKPKVNTETKTIEFENIFTYIGNKGNVILNDLYKSKGKKTNLKELPKQINVRFLKDALETNTFLRIDALGINLQAQEVNSIGNQISVDYSLNGVDETNTFLNETLDVVLDFSRGWRKNEMKGIEKLFNTIYDVVSSVKSVFGNSGSGGGKLGDRIGYLMLSNDWVVIDKIFLLDDDGKISKNNFKINHAERIFNDYYIKEGIDYNQWHIFASKEPEPFYSQILINDIKQNNVQSDYDGRTIVITNSVRADFTDLYKNKFRRKMQQGDFGFIEKEKINIERNYND